MQIFLGRIWFEGAFAKIKVKELVEVALLVVAKRIAISETSSAVQGEGGFERVSAARLKAETAQAQPCGRLDYMLKE